MGKWEMVRLGDVCIGTVTNIAQKDLADNNGVYPIYGASGFIKYVDFYKQDKPYIAVVKDGAGVGRVSRMPAKSSIIGTMQNILPNKNIDVNYLYYAMLKMNLGKFYTGATIPHIYFKDYKKEELSLPPLSIQQKIADVLDRANTLIEKRKAQIEKLDLLVKSQFVEMFGYINKNPYNFPVMRLSEVCNKITDGKHGGCELEYGSGYFFVGAREIYNSEIHYDTAQEITFKDFQESYKRCNIEIGDFVIVNTGATIGKTAIATDQRTNITLLQKSVALLKTKKDLLLPRFLQYCYITNPTMYKVESASAQPNLLLSKIKDTKIIIPPLELQDKFAAFVERVETQKSLMKKGLELMELGYKSLMQKCFNGEMFT